MLTAVFAETEGVDLEEAGEKWRAGDPVKSMRFFMRAIEMYETGLRRYPASFDLAYNKYVYIPFTLMVFDSRS